MWGFVCVCVCVFRERTCKKDVSSSSYRSCLSLDFPWGRPWDKDLPASHLFGSAGDTHREVGKWHREGKTNNKEWVIRTYSHENSGKWGKTQSQNYSVWGAGSWGIHTPVPESHWLRTAEGRGDGIVISWNVSLYMWGQSPKVFRYRDATLAVRREERCFMGRSKGHRWDTNSIWDRSQ